MMLDVAQSGGDPPARPGCVGAAAACTRRRTAGDPEQQQPEVHRHQLVLGLVVQFYSSWCGHCIQYSSTWKSLAQDVKDWQQVISVAVLDCAQEENFDVCKEFSIRFYPTFKYFRAHSAVTDRGTTYRGADREIQSVRQLMVNVLQNHTRLDRPDLCPPLEPYSSVELLPLLGQSEKRLRFFFSSFLRTLPGVQRRMKSAVSSSTVGQGGALQDKHSMEPWRDFDRAKVYSADLESALHYLLRVELATHNTLEGEELKVFKDFVTLFAKLYPGLEGEAAPVLQVMRQYIRTFFGCEECGRHFEQAAAAGVDQVQNREQQILWLWNQHNMVNYRLAGSLSDDPLFPKSPWPSPALCASCHEEKNGVHVWNYEMSFASCDITTEPPTCPPNTP
ncbi:hypothetical protein INR49_021221 [Caranx melampygus]|nr:hypothetical protein INR49_021221 [Caranx melampygus]